MILSPLLHIIKNKINGDSEIAWKKAYQITKSDVFASLSGTVLDVGCGSGKYFTEIHYFQRAKNYIGIESDIKALRKAKEKLYLINNKSKNSKNKISLVIGDAETLPFRKHTFNSVCMIASYNHIPRIDKALIEVKRVLKETGVFVMNDHTYNRFWWTLKNVISIIFKKHSLPRIRCQNLNEALEKLKTQGFSILKAENVPSSMPIFWFIKAASKGL